MPKDLPTTNKSISEIEHEELCKIPKQQKKSYVNNS